MKIIFYSLIGLAFLLTNCSKDSEDFLETNSRLKSTIAPGTYTLQNRAKSLFIDGMGRTSSGSICGQWAGSTSNNQQWVVENVGGTYIKLKNVATGLYLDGAGASSNGSVVKQYSSGSSYNQQWLPEAVDSYYKFKNRATGLYIDRMGSTTNGSDLGQWGSSTSYNQQWAATIVGGDGGNIVNVPLGGNIQVAIDQVEAAGGGIVNLAAGTYTISASILVPSNIVLNGAGMYSSIIKPSKLSATYAILSAKTYPVNNITVQNLSVDGRGSNCQGVNINECQTGFKLYNLYLKGCKGQQCSCGGTTGAIVDNVISEYGGGNDLYHTFYWRRSNNITVKNSTFNNSGGSGFKLSIGTTMWVTNCQFNNCAKEGFITQDLNNDVHVVNCSASNNARQGFNLAANNGSVVDGCTASNNGWDGFYVNTNAESTACYIKNCTSQGNTYNNLSIHGAWQDGGGNVVL